MVPFKAQNMSLNSHVTKDGDEIARAQALQAHAAGIEPTAEMNPILLKPKAEHISQVIVHGRPYADMNVGEYHDFVEKKGRMIVKTSLEHLLSEYDLVIMEGAGSPAEINIMHRDIVNIYPAGLAEAKCILVHNIEHGGSLAYLSGTLSLLGNESELYSGIIINKSRGAFDTSELESVIEKPVLGVVPYIEDLHLPEEDSLGLKNHDDHFDVGVIRLPYISNFTDFDALKAEGLRIRYISRVSEAERASVLIIPGTKNTIKDLKWLRERGFDHAIIQAANDGKRIIDNGFEDAPDGTSDRVVVSKRFQHDREDEIIQDGAIDGRIFGTYVHGIFDSPSVRKAVLRAMKRSPNAIERDLDDEIDRLVRVVSGSVDIERVEALI